MKNTILIETEYDKQAEQFLQDTNTSLRTEFLKHGKYFPHEQESRDIYRITIIRGTRIWQFTFGQSLNDSGLILFYRKSGERTQHKGFIIPDELRLRLENTKDEKEKQKATSNISWWFDQNHFSLSGLMWKFIRPTAYHVLAALQKYDVGSLEDFCADFGYDTDSITATKTYHAVLEEWKNVQMIWTDDEIEKLREIQ